MKIRYFTVPNILTLLNLLAGCAAIVFSFCFEGGLRYAFWFMVASAVFDFFDGFAARALKSYSPLGKQLDSLADMVSFGVAPSVMLFAMCVEQDHSMWAMAVFIIAVFSALRLARFNIDEEQGEEFIGLPTPACALFFGSAVHLYAAGLYTVDPIYVIIAAVVFSWLLISPIRMFSLKFHGFSLRDNKNKLRYVFLALSLAALVIFKMVAVPFIILAYILISIATNLVCSKK